MTNEQDYGKLVEILF